MSDPRDTDFEELDREQELERLRGYVRDALNAYHACKCKVCHANLVLATKQFKRLEASQ